MTREQTLGLMTTVLLHAILLLGLAAWKIDIRGPAEKETASPNNLSSKSDRHGAALTGDSVRVATAKTSLAEPSKEVPLARNAEKKPSGTAKEGRSDRENSPSLETLEGKGFVVTSSYSWSDGSRRKKVSGALPKPTDNASAGGSATLDIVVAPNGTVKSMKAVPATRTGFEREAVRQVRRWRFEVVPRSQPQRDQHCVVSFLLRR